MEFDKKAPDWKNPGAEPPEELKTKGFTAGYKPPAGYFNWFWHRIGECLKELQAKLNGLTKADVGLDQVDNTADAAKPVSDAVKAELGKKVDQVDGKGLSANDYTTEEKTKLAGMEDGANHYVHPDRHPAAMITENSEKRFVTEAEKAGWDAKAEGVHEHDGRYYTEAETDAKLTNKANVSHTHTKSQITDFPENIPASGGNSDTVNGHTVESDVPAGAKFTDTVYVHPTTAGNKHIPAGGASGQILRWSAAGTAVWGADNNTTYGVATTSANGLMAAADKTKLNGIAEGANRYVHPSTHPAGMITGLPTSLPANGGNADTVDGAHGYQIETLNEGGVSHGTSHMVVCQYNVNKDNRFFFRKEGNDHQISVAHALYANSAGSANAVAWGNVSGKPGTYPPSGHTHDDRYYTEAETNNLLNGKAPIESPVFTGSISLGRRTGTSIGLNSFAVGNKTSAVTQNSHAEGSETVAGGQGSHAEGCVTFAQEFASHAEGDGANALGQCSHAEGRVTTASGMASHAEGDGTIASEACSHAEGCKTLAQNFASHAGGKYSKPMLTGGTWNNKVGDVFVLGNGTGDNALSNAFRITYAGAVYGLSNFNSTGADYAEFFEWQDGNPNIEDRVGYFVTLDGNQIKPASPGDYLLGIVSGQPCIIGNSDEDWLGRWEHDEFGRFVKEDVDTPITKPEIVETPVLDADGNPTGETRPKRIEVETGNINGWRYKANPDYDASQPYVERKDRPEWSAVGMLGVLSVRDNGQCTVNGFCTCGEGGIAVPTEDRKNGYRVIRRMTDSVVQAVFR